MIHFDQLTHTYTTEEGKQLMSVTTAIKTYVLPHKYDGVKADVLAAAAKRGNEIHTRVDSYHKGFPFADNNAFEGMKAYIKWCKANPRNIYATEYLVSDGNLIAGTIDQLESLGGRTYAIGDVKTTYEVDEEYLSWQLSLYAYCFEKEAKRPKNVVTELYCLHIRDGKCERHEITRLPNRAIKALLKAIEEGADTFNNPLKKSTKNVDELVAKYRELAIDQMEAEQKANMKKEQMNIIAEQLKEIADKRGQTVIESKFGTIKRGKDTTRMLFSKEMFIKKHPDMKEDMEACVKPSTVLGKVSITLK